MYYLKKIENKNNNVDVKKKTVWTIDDDDI